MRSGNRSGVRNEKQSGNRAEMRNGKRIGMHSENRIGHKTWETEVGKRPVGKSERKGRIRFLTVAALALLAVFLCIAAETCGRFVPIDGGASAKGEGVLRVHYLDVGQGDSEFLELPGGKTMLIDAGVADAAPTVIDYIRNLGYSRIDYVVATHPHADHIGGMAAVLKAFDVGEVWAPKVSANTKTFEKFLDAVAAKGLSINTAEAGKVLVGEGECEVAILSPRVGASYEDLNDWSVVLKVMYGKRAFLFTGDASTEVIDAAHAGTIDALKVGHHGSKSSTTKALVASLEPEAAVIEVGANNDYGHPTKQALDALSGNGVTVYRTDEDGTCVATCDGSAIAWTTHARAEDLR